MAQLPSSPDHPQSTSTPEAQTAASSIVAGEAQGFVPSDETPFRLTRVWLIVGIAAIVIGVLSGFIMSSATFLR